MTTKEECEYTTMIQMDKIELKIKKIHGSREMQLPQYMSPGASGLDLCAHIEHDGEFLINPMERVLVPTGIAVSVPQGYEIQIRPRSGLAIKHGITLLNTPGTIDSDYRGEICLIVINLGNEPFIIENGMRLAQMVVAKYVRVTPAVVDTLDETERNTGGFGHTGI